MLAEIEIKDDMQIFADFLGEMIAKYICKINLEELPDPDLYLTLKNLKWMYKVLAQKRREMQKEKDYFEIEYVFFGC